MEKIHFESQLKVLKENKFYRFSDLFSRKGMRWESDRKTILQNVEFEDTILRKYLEQKKHEEDYVTLKKIVADHTKLNNYKIPTEKELVIHLRLGDTFTKEFFEFWKENIIKKSNSIFKKDSIIYSDQIDKVTIVTALHFGANELIQSFFYTDESYAKNIDFLKSFEQKVNDCGFELNLISNENVDVDLGYMAKSNHFVKSVGGFANLVEVCLDEGACVY